MSYFSSEYDSVIAMPTTCQYPNNVRKHGQNEGFKPKLRYYT